MLQHVRDSYADPAKAQRYRLAALLIATDAFVVFGVASAVAIVPLKTVVMNLLSVGAA